MWLDSPAEFIHRFGISAKQALHFQCTAEHRIAKQDGGTDSAANIAGACLACNHRRHARKYPLTLDQYLARVRVQVAARKWHPKWAFDRGIVIDASICSCK